MRTGQKLTSTACMTEIIIVRAPVDDVDLWCGGAPMALEAVSGERSGVVGGFDGPSALGKRYADDESGIEILVTKGGDGALSIGDRVLEQKQAKALPSSD